jgi:hypothetical protein
MFPGAGVQTSSGTQVAAERIAGRSIAPASEEINLRPYSIRCEEGQGWSRTAVAGGCQGPTSVDWLTGAGRRSIFRVPKADCEP